MDPMSRRLDPATDPARRHSSLVDELSNETQHRITAGELFRKSVAQLGGSSADNDEWFRAPER